VPAHVAAGNGKVWTTLADGTLQQFTAGSGILDVSYNPFLYSFRGITYGAPGLVAIKQGNFGFSNFIDVNLFDIVSNGYSWSYSIGTGDLARSVASGDGRIWATFPDGSIRQYASLNGSFQVGTAPFFWDFTDLTYGSGGLSAVRAGNFGSSHSILVGIFDIVSNGYSASFSIPTATPATNIAAGNGSIYATFADGTLARYSATTGSLQSSVLHPDYRWTDLAYSDGVLYASGEFIPEPGTWALMAAGITALGFLRRRARPHTP
jgi:hypothetical protein